MAVERQKDASGAWNTVEADTGGGGGGGSQPALLTITRIGGTRPIPTIPLVAASLQDGNTAVPVVAVPVLNNAIPSDATSLVFENLQAIIGESYSLGNNLPSLVTLGFPALFYVGGDFYPYGMAALTSLDLPLLATVGGWFSPNSLAALTSLDLPLLASFGSDFSPNSLAALTSLDLPLLATVGGDFSPYGMAALTSLDLPLLATVGGTFSPSIMAALTSLDLPLLATVGGDFSPSTMAALTSLTLTSALKEVGGNVGITGCPLDQATVDGILVRFAALDGTGGTTTYDGHTINLADLAAVPSATGLAAKATLEGRGNTVTVN